MAAKDVRVRFAPSPTGNLHIGGMRTALFNWLFARHAKGTFLIRVEDTDKERSTKEYVKAQCDALEWVGITSDEPLVFQSQRTSLYTDALEKLFAEKKIYRCVCTPEDVEARVRAKGNNDQFYNYDGACRKKDFSAESDTPFVIRFAVPENISSLVVQDLIRGEITFEKDQLDDFIIVRSDGSPTYNFVVVIDDHQMGITQIIRGEDHISNTPKQLLLYQALEFEVPEFAHIPLIMGAEGQRLSKRDGAVDVLHYKEEGYLPDALVNYVVRLGWSHGDQEEFTREELISLFSLDAVGKKSAIFDMQKLQWLNGVYMRKTPAIKLFHWLSTELEPDLGDKLVEWEPEQIEKAIELYKDRTKTGKELLDALYLLYDGPLEYNKEDFKKWITPEAKEHLEEVEEILEEQDDFSADELSEVIKEFCSKKDIKLVSIAQPLRVALVGSASSPGVFELLALIGKEESLMRIDALQNHT